MTDAIGSHPLEQPTGAESPPPTIARDIACRQCGYNLRGLLETSRCPECGVGVADSIHIHVRLLRDSNSNWLKTLTVGALFIIAAPAIFILFMFLRIAVDLMWQFDGPDSLRDFLQQASDVMAPTGVTFLLLGIWMFAAAEPGAWVNERNWRRIMIRIGVTIGAAAFLLSRTEWVQWNNEPIGLYSPRVVVMALAALAIIPMQFAVIVRLRHLAARLPDMGMVDELSVFLWATAAGYGSAILGIVISLCSEGLGAAVASSGLGIALIAWVPWTFEIGIFRSNVRRQLKLPHLPPLQP